MFLMYLVAAVMLAVPALIAMYIHRGRVGVTRENWQEALACYLIYAFLIQTLEYGFMFVTRANRTVSLSPLITADSDLFSASFVFKYSFAALLLSAALPLAAKYAREIRLPRLADEAARSLFARFEEYLRDNADW